MCGHFVQLQRSEYLVNAVRLTKGARRWENTHAREFAVCLSYGRVIPVLLGKLFLDSVGAWAVIWP